MRVRRVLGIEDEKAARALAQPLDEPMVAGALEQRFNAIERILNAATAICRGLGPLINHGRGKIEVGGNLLGRLFVKNLAEQFVGFHAAKMKELAPLGKLKAPGRWAVAAAFSRALAAILG